MSRKRWYFFPPLILAALAAFSFLTMILWNALLPVIFHLPIITFWQAVGLLILSRLFFSSGPWNKGHRHPWGNHLREKWEKMTPEEREKLREKLQSHGHPWANYMRESRCGMGKEEPMG